MFGDLSLQVVKPLQYGVFDYLYNLPSQAIFIPFDDLSTATAARVLNLTGVNTAAVSGALLGQTESFDAKPSVYFDGINDFVNYYSAALNSAFIKTEGTINIFWKPFDASVWSGATVRGLSTLRSAGTSYIEFSKQAANQFRAHAPMNGVTQSFVQNSQSYLTWKMLTISWSVINNRIRYYNDGVQVGSTLSPIGVWSIALSSGNCTIGALNTSASNPINCWVKYFSILNYEMTPADIAEIFDLSGI